MKGIILAGGLGTRLLPLTKAVSKQLLPIGDKPMVYYPLSVLMMAKIKDIALISTPQDIENFKRLLGDGSSLGVKIEYILQPEPGGIAQAFLLSENFIGSDSVCLILGDNIFYGYDFSRLLHQTTKKQKKGAKVFAYQVSDPKQFGVVTFDEKMNATSIEEKPSQPKTNYAVVGLYLYDNEVIEISKKLEKSSRGELEITDVNNEYLKKGRLTVSLLEKGFAWLDTGTSNSLMEAGLFVNTIEKRQGIKIGCVEEVAYRNGWISKKQLNKIASSLKNTDYGRYLTEIVKEK